MSKSTERIMVNKRIKEMRRDDFYCNITELCEHLKKAEAEGLAKGFADIRLDIDIEIDESGNPYPCYDIRGNILENDKEYNHRMEIIKNNKTVHEMHERQELARLKAKYEGEVKIS